jgi:hypothetical protein
MRPANRAPPAGFNRVNLEDVGLVVFGEGMILLVQGDGGGIVIDADVNRSTNAQLEAGAPATTAAESVHGDFVEYVYLWHLQPHLLSCTCHPLVVPAQVPRAGRVADIFYKTAAAGMGGQVAAVFVRMQNVDCIGLCRRASVGDL